jgi:hypothetical protein
MEEFEPLIQTKVAVFFIIFPYCYLTHILDENIYSYEFYNIVVLFMLK